MRLRARIEAADADPAPVPRSWIGHRYIQAAAAAALLLAGGFLWQRVRMARIEPFKQVSTRAGERRSLLLSDSTLVTIGPATTLRYRIGATAREVMLDGLASFRVRHDSQRPFSVRASNALATDLGTEFAVRAYSSDSTVEVHVTAGRVALAGTADARTISLGQGQSGRVSRTGVVLNDDTSSMAATAWLDGTLVFEEARLNDVALELSRWYGVDVRIADSTLGARRVTARYVHTSLNDVLAALSATLGTRAVHNGRNITLITGAR